MTARSAVHVHVTSKDGTKRAWLQPGDEVPSWARLDKRNLQQATEDTGSGTAASSDGVPQPARAGKGSGIDAWRAFAESKGVGVDSGMSRDDIVAACEQAGVLTVEE